MNLILLQPDDFIGKTLVRISDARLTQIREVHGSSTGDTVRVGQINGKMGQGIITAIDDNSVKLEVTLDCSPPKKLPLTLILAMPRPKMLRRIFRTIAELGVAELHLINSYRVEKSFWQTPVLEEKTIEKYLLQGLQQAKDTILPKVKLHQRFKPFIEDDFPSLIKNKKALLAHPGTGIPCPHNIDQATVLVVGPEGGFIPYEVEKILDTGCEGIHLGQRILRVENAVNVLVAKLFD